MTDWGVGKFLTFVLIFVIALYASFVQISKITGSFGDSNIDDKEEPEEVENETPTSYQDIEEQLTFATKRYMDKYYPKVSDGDNFVIQLSSLIDERYMGTVRDIKNKSIRCNGYTVVYNNGTEVTYNSYIKCGNNYETLEYSTRLQEKY